MGQQPLDHVLINTAIGLGETLLRLPVFIDTPLNVQTFVNPIFADNDFLLAAPANKVALELFRECCRSRFPLSMLPLKVDKNST
jgi:ABC-type tungstate transport system substrate-binding protein